MEIKRIEISPYTLEASKTLNRLSSNTKRAGALLRVYFEEFEQPGHADLFPWPELGDETLGDQLSALKSGAGFRLGSASLGWAYAEAKAVNDRVHLLDGTKVGNHLTLTGPGDISDPFKTAKIKMGSQEILQWSKLQAWMEQHPEVHWRLDFNGYFQEIDQAQAWWSQVSGGIKKKIEFLEDPFDATLMESPKARDVFRDVQWAIDRFCSPEAMDLADVWVIKPVYYSCSYLQEEIEYSPQQLVITSNMDHPLGQLMALSVAQLCQRKFPDRLLDCGLRTQHLFDFPHAQWLTDQGTSILPATTGPGWGCGEQLHHLPWALL